MNAIAAVSRDWGIGRAGELLFHIPEDLRRFRALTTGGTVIMGRKTLDSLPGGRPLPNRRNLVLTRNAAFSRPLPGGASGPAGGAGSGPGLGLRRRGDLPAAAALVQDLPHHPGL